MNSTDVTNTASSAAVVDFDKIECYGRGKSKLINNKIHLEFHDEYEHDIITNSMNSTTTTSTINNGLEYIIENVLMEQPLSFSSTFEHNSYEKLRKLYNTYYSMNCNCNNIVFTNNIPNNMNECNNFDYCIHGGNYIPSVESLTKDKPHQQQELVLNENRRSKDLIYECSDKCLCPTICHNRLIQYGPRNNLIIIDVSHLNKQLGLSSTKSICKGAFVCEYVGEIITKDEAQKRHELNSIHNRMNYIICLNEYPMIVESIEKVCAGHVERNCGKCCLEQQQKQEQQHVLKTTKGVFNDCTSDNPCPDGDGDGASNNISSYNNVGKHLQTFIDPSRKGNIGRYLNHSCDPNCEILSIRIDGPIPRLGIFTKRHVMAGEELCFDYGDCLNTDVAVKTIGGSDMNNHGKRKWCYCGTKKCRIFLPNVNF